MNKFGFSLLLVVMLAGAVPFSISFMQTANISQEVSTGIRNGNARDVAKHFGANVDLKLPGNEGTFSRNQAELMLRNFFTRHAPESFTVSHQGSSRDGSVYLIGVYGAKGGTNFRTYCLIKKISDQMVLHQLQFEAQ
jgi:hypothetical protein